MSYPCGDVECPNILYTRVIQFCDSILTGPGKRGWSSLPRETLSLLPCSRCNDDRYMHKKRRERKASGVPISAHAMIGVSEHSRNDSPSGRRSPPPLSPPRNEIILPSSRPWSGIQGPYVYINRAGTLKYLDRRLYVDRPLFAVHLDTQERREDLQSPPFTPVLPFVTTLHRG